MPNAQHHSLAPCYPGSISAQDSPWEASAPERGLHLEGEDDGRVSEPELLLLAVRALASDGPLTHSSSLNPGPRSDIRDSLSILLT